MITLLGRMSEEMGKAFAGAGFPAEAGRVSVSNRPDLCEFQCNGAMSLAKREHKNPMEIAEAVAAALTKGETFPFIRVSAVKPGFLNFDLDPAFLRDYVREMGSAEKFGIEAPDPKQRIIIDYGGPNVAKPLHVGHLRAAVIGESIKRILKYAGHETIGDIHMGDWGLQMGLIISELKERQPGLPYFDPDYAGDYPDKAPFTISELEEIYPAASKKSKEDESFKEKAMDATKRLQDGERGFRALWEKIIEVSVADLKKNYDKLDVHFELWNGESTVHDEIPAMVQRLKDGGYAYLSDGALVVDVAQESDKKPIPPCMVLKSDGAALYNTTDLATLLVRNRDYHPDRIIYVVDKRQELYFEQVFRCAKKTGLIDPKTELIFIGFGTMNGPDGKPFKTREGGVMRLESLISQIEESVKSDDETTRDQIALAALKYGDLSNQATKDYAFDIGKFTSFEGDTGPYLLYTIVRIKSILRKAAEEGHDASSLTADALNVPSTEGEKKLLLSLADFPSAFSAGVAELAPHRLCAYAFSLANAFNSFYHETKILAEEDPGKRKGYLALAKLCMDILEAVIGMLGFTAPERM